MTDESSKSEAEVKLLQNLREALQKCLVCERALPSPFKKSECGRFIEIRCRKHQAALEKVWFRDYDSYIAVFGGQT